MMMGYLAQSLVLHISLETKLNFNYLDLKSTKISVGHNWTKANIDLIYEISNTTT